MAGTHEDSLSRDEAIKILNTWGSKGFFRTRNLESSHIEAIEHTPCFTFRAKTQYERRSVETLSKPYYGERLDNKGTPPDMWDITVEKPSGYFGNTFTDVIIPHTDQVSPCHTCHGNCKISCSGCAGRGRQRCSCNGGRLPCSCAGGQVAQIEWETVYDHHGYATSVSKTVYQMCSACGGAGSRPCNNCGGCGEITCSWCRGYGDVTCETCQARGKVKTYRMLHVRFEYRDHSQIIGAMEIPDTKIVKVTGKKILNKRDNRITTVHELSDKKLAKHALEFFSQCNTSNALILYQHFEIDEIPVFKVSYKKHSNSKTKFLWIYGNEHEIYSDGEWNISPNTKKVGFVATGVAAFSVIGIVGAYFFNRPPDSPQATEESLVSANAFCDNLQLKERRLALGINYSDSVDSRFRQQYSDAPSSLDKTNEAHAPYLKGWCHIADEWLTEQEKQVSSKAPKKKLETSDESPTGVCSMIVQGKLNKKTGEIERTSPCGQ
ncbi:hypothetical protein IQ278_12135 [Tolypothrix sp. LEGE 11397]|uniref:hypothetical protein n=1 Tax=Tolypothrix sp. LEGE 11397 TaxID=2777971 RepID=UPI00187EE5A3|nr:hypothetical protein [Tolypothrix sp. LEGE 11397]MBE9082863.1 hypothetical protein [Tolypothrix sp. LEGE 11397]